ncbi:MAG: hypothetical protein P8P30_07295 [Rickettsiales bacterium]|nr:hypothetical protein [Rickettsiales bacterium]
MNRFWILSLTLGLTFAVPAFIGVPSTAQAQVSDHYSVPLAVVRFNQPRVYFQRPVGNAVRRAMQVSPGVEFKIIHYAPQGSSHVAEKSERNLQSVLKYLYSLGVDSGKVQVQKQVASGLPHSEVHLYVR